MLLRDGFDVLRDIWVRSVLLTVRLTPGRPGNRTMDALRGILLRLIKIEAGAGSQISPGFFAFRAGGVRFGRDCRVGYDFKVWNFSPLVVGDGLLASHNVSIICGTHLTDAARTNVPGPVSIGNNVWIGANVLIVGPATIGDGAILGANSYVTGDIPPHSAFGGSPARALRRGST